MRETPTPGQTPDTFVASVFSFVKERAASHHYASKFPGGALVVSIIPHCDEARQWVLECNDREMFHNGEESVEILAVTALVGNEKTTIIDDGKEVDCVQVAKAKTNTCLDKSKNGVLALSGFGPDEQQYKLNKGYAPWKGAYAIEILAADCTPYCTVAVAVSGGPQEYDLGCALAAYHFISDTFFFWGLEADNQLAGYDLDMDAAPDKIVQTIEDIFGLHDYVV